MPSDPLYTFCETSMAGPTSPVHIRIYEPPRQLHGGVPGNALCGIDLLKGWDLNERVDHESIYSRMHERVGRVCLPCSVAFGYASPHEIVDETMRRLDP